MVSYVEWLGSAGNAWRASQLPNRSLSLLVSQDYHIKKSRMSASARQRESTWNPYGSYPSSLNQTSRYTRANLCDDKITFIPSRPRESTMGITEQPRLLSSSQNIKTPPPCSIRVIASRPFISTNNKSQFSNSRHGTPSIRICTLIFALYSRAETVCC